MKADNKGFTLVELMITLAMSGIIVAAVYSAYSVQQRAYGKQEQIITIQDTLRVALYSMEHELRMAGFDPNMKEDTGFDTVSESSISFSFSKCKEAKTGSEPVCTKKNVTYKITEKEEGGEKHKYLTRNDEDLGKDIEQIEFWYTLKNGKKTLDPSSEEIEDIRAVTISILGRAEKPDNSFTNNNNYIPASGKKNWKPTGANKHYRYQLFITTVKCRNMGALK